MKNSKHQITNNNQIQPSELFIIWSMLSGTLLNLLNNYVIRDVIDWNDLFVSPSHNFRIWPR